MIHPIENLFRTGARVLTGSTFAILGFDAAKTPGGRVDMAIPTLDAMREYLPLPRDNELIVRANGAIQAGAGLTLALGFFPRLSALAIAGSMVPTTLAGHAFWKQDNPEHRKPQQVQFHKNLAMIGGLLYAAADRPSQ